MVEITHEINMILGALSSAVAVLLVIIPMMKKWVQKPLSELKSSLILIEKHQAEMKEQIKVNQDITFQTIYDRLVYLCTKYINGGEISAVDLERLTDMYTAYARAGGNHYAKDLFERVGELPIRKV